MFVAFCLSWIRLVARPYHVPVLWQRELGPESHHHGVPSMCAGPSPPISGVPYWACHPRTGVGTTTVGKHMPWFSSGSRKAPLLSFLSLSPPSPASAGSTTVVPAAGGEREEEWGGGISGLVQSDSEQGPTEEVFVKDVERPCLSCPGVPSHNMF